MKPKTDDPLGAFVRHDLVCVDGAAGGPLEGLTFAAKDIFDVAGHVTGCGNPDWLRTHGRAGATAPAIERLLAAGATLVGKTLTDELAYSLDGENVHYGTPVNPRAPGRLAGGSSCGSAAAVAGHLVDFALGSDTGGSVRVPASHCGVYGMRPTHGRIPVEGVIPLAPSFDTVGWFADSPQMLSRVGRVLLGGGGAAGRPQRWLLAEEAFERADPEVRDVLRQALDRVADITPPRGSLRLGSEKLETLAETFRVLQGAEVWQVHGQWIEQVRPTLGPGVSERFAVAATILAEDVANARRRRAAFTRQLEEQLGTETLLCLPSTPSIAPERNRPIAVANAQRARLLSLTCIAGLAGLPQISLPLSSVTGCPVGLSLIGWRGGDEVLLELAGGIG
ncbi:MAG: amidase [Planctomycetota bacterium]